MLHRQFFLSRSWFPDHLPSAGLVGCKKNSLLGDVLTCFRRCVQSMLRVTEVQTIVCLIPRSLSVAERCMLTLTLVTTLVSTRCSVLPVWSERKTHCSRKPGTLSIQRCPPPPLLPHALLPLPHQKKHVFSMIWETASGAP